MARLGRTRVQVATTALILLGVLAVPPDAPAARATVVRVVDGDTVLLRTANGTTRLNLRGIDAPELGECFGASARRRLARLLPRRSRVTTSRGEIRRRGRSVNVSMVRGGYAVRTGSARGSLRDRLIDAQDSAIDASRGLHDACGESAGGGGGGNAPAVPSTRNTDAGAVQGAVNGTVWFWTRFEQAGTGGTTDRTRIDLCTDGTIKVRRSSVTDDGQGNTFTVIQQDFGRPWSVSSGFTDPATNELQAVVDTTIAYRRVRTAAQGVQESEPNEAFRTTLERRADGSAVIDGRAGSLLPEPADCGVEP